MVSSATLECRSRGTDSGPSRDETRWRPKAGWRTSDGRRLRRHPPVTGTPIHHSDYSAGPRRGRSQVSQRRGLGRGLVASTTARPRSPRMRGGQVRSALKGDLSEERVLAIETKWPRRRHEIADGRLLPARDFTHRNSVLPVRPVIAIRSFRKSICRGCQRREQSRIAPVSFPHRP